MKDLTYILYNTNIYKLDGLVVKKLRFAIYYLMDIEFVEWISWLGKIVSLNSFFYILKMVRKKWN